MSAQIIDSNLTYVTSQQSQRGTALLIIFDKGNEGAIILYEQMVRNNYPCKLIYYLKDNQANRESLKDFILTLPAIFIGFSFTSHSKDVAFKIADYIRNECAHIPIIFGGIHPTLDPVKCLEHCHAVCRGEGELVILELMEKIYNGEDYSTLKNLVYRKNGQVIWNDLNPLISDLDTLPQRRPWTSDHMFIKDGRICHIDKKLYSEITPFRKISLTQSFSRGCPYSCAYCCNSKYKKLYPTWAKVRSRSVTATINEIYNNVKLNNSLMRVFMIDDCFLWHDIEWLKDFVKQWQEKINLSLTVFAIAEYVTYEKLKVLKNIDIDRISIGLQTGSKRMSALFNRRFSPETFLQACRLIRSMNINIAVDLLFDNPWENEDDRSQTLNILTQVPKPFLLAQYSLKIYPGTQLYENNTLNNQNVPDFNFSYDHVSRIKITDINILYLLTQILPRNIIFYLYNNRSRITIRIILRILYAVVLVVTPFLYLHIMVPRGIKRKIKFLFYFRENGLRLIKDLLGID